MNGEDHCKRPLRRLFATGCARGPGSGDPIRDGLRLAGSDR